MRATWPPILFGLAFLGTWELIVVLYDIKTFLLPAPSAILSALADNVGSVWDAVRVTGTNALVGLLLGTVVGVALSFALMRFRVLNELVTPLAVALNAIPIIIVVPVLNNMFSTTSQVGRRLMVLLIVLFIVLVNVAKGLRQVSATHVELMRSYAATPWEILVKIRIPNAVPYLFTALRIAAPLAVITAFVAEYFGGTQDGLGSRITSNAANSRNDVMWAYVIGACVLGLTFYLLAILIENAAGRHQGRTRSTTTTGTTATATPAAPTGVAAHS
ncbi:MAG: ABC transporter permease [Ilumatobacter sp.]|nr:ABC transporter permease [Ilumatobacter sp.]